MKRFNIQKGLLASILVMGFSSCLKDTPNFNPDDSNNVTEFAPTFSIVEKPTATAAVSYLADLGTMNMNDTSGFNINISYSGADQAPQDMDVVVDVDNAALDAYNTAHDEENILPPTSVIDVSKVFPVTIKIKKGEHRGQFRVPAKLTTDYDFDEAYIIPLTIKSTSVGPVSGNYGKALYRISVRNKYDGVYTATGTMVDVTSTANKGKYPKTINLVTSSDKSVSYFDPNLNGGLNGYSFNAGTSGSYFGNFGPIFNFNDNGSVASVSNYYGTATQNASKRDAGLDATGINKMTFGTDGKPKTLEVSYYMYQSGVIRLKITEKFEYTGPRD